MRAIGSVIPTPKAATSARSALSHLTNGQPWRGFRTARGALAALLRHRRIKRIWLPAYICRTLFEGASDCEVAWYETDERLEINLDSLAPDGGDAVFVVDYFGRSPKRPIESAWHSHVLWIEDRAQALAPDGPAFGDVVLHSPRKLFGVADGGILVGDDLPQPMPCGTGPDLWEANDLRAADPDGEEPAAWFLAFRAREAAFTTEACGIDPRTISALDQIDVEAEIAARRANWRILAQNLADIALWPDIDAAFAPLAFPVVVDDAAALSAHLASERIWCARHWADLPSPQTFAAAHALSRRCLSLPLDGRYGEDDMNRMIAAIRRYPR